MGTRHKKRERKKKSGLHSWSNILTHNLVVLRWSWSISPWRKGSPLIKVKWNICYGIQWNPATFCFPPSLELLRFPRFDGSICLCHWQWQPLLPQCLACLFARVERDSRFRRRKSMPSPPFENFEIPQLARFMLGSTTISRDMSWSSTRCNVILLLFLSMIPLAFLWLLKLS